jgi:hypothetical protein
MDTSQANYAPFPVFSKSNKSWTKSLQKAIEPGDFLLHLLVSTGEPFILR